MIKVINGSKGSSNRLFDVINKKAIEYGCYYGWVSSEEITQEQQLKNCMECLRENKGKCKL